MSDFAGDFEYEALEPAVEALFMTIGVDLPLLAEALERHAREVRQSIETSDDE